jgi:hypothetical protein
VVLGNSGSSLSIAISSGDAISFGPNAVRCFVDGLATPTAAAMARSEVSISTFDSSGRKVDTSTLGIEIPPIFNHFATRINEVTAPVKMSSSYDPHYIRSTLLSSFLVCFKSSGTGSIKTVTVQGMSDFTTLSAAFSSAQTCSYSGVEYSSMTRYSDPFLSIILNTSGFPAAQSDIICTVRGLVLPSFAQATKDNLVISTFDENSVAVETMAGVSLPSIFASVASSVSVTLSSVISNDVNVAMTLSFISPNPPVNSGPKGSIKVISLSGVFFQSFSEIQSKCYHQNGEATGEATLNSSTLVIRLAGTDSIASGPQSVTCSVLGFRNIASQRRTDLSVRLSTWDNPNIPLDISSAVAFPNIYAFPAFNGSIALSSQIIEKSGVTMTLKFMVPFTNQAITSITLSGLPFSAPSSQTAPSALCQSVSSNSVTLTVIGAASELTMKFGSGLPVGSGILTLTCKISNLVNAPTALRARSTVSLFVFSGIESNSLPLYFLSSIMFPPIFEQSLGYQRPRVRLCSFFVF